ncbi:MAG: tRNA threonylcarbamoyladenosine dehydratase [Firmicutes bacterium]|nr:tRNA threonylcarbamoyladenosine dehydratase [Bacillota bacterium]MDY2720762.1 tRNA threonylcarbamoyladenosine dehydratase [Candidatus Faecousia sp.]
MSDAFLREEMLLGADATARLRASHVAVFGIGGVGSYAVEALARAGVGALTLIDNDTVGETNLNRQLCALHSTIGQYKAEVMAGRVRDINPDCRVTPLPLLYNEASKERFFQEKYDYIIDAIDLVSCKLSLIQTAMSRGIPIVSAMGTGNKLDPSKFCITDISKTSGCHLARIMRRELRSRGIVHHTVLYSQELPAAAEQREAPPPGRRSVPGSVSWVPSCAGLMLAGFVVQQLIKPEADG